MKNFFIKSLGCKQNQLEGQIIQESLVKFGYAFEKDISKCDIYILNSCSVTSHADSEGHYLLNLAKRKNPNIKTILMGCTAQTYNRHKDYDYSNIDLVLGNSEKMHIEKYIQKLSEDNENFYVDDIMQKNVFDNKLLLNPDTTRVSIKIQDGCNNRCAYCIIPYARGNSRSNTVKNILEQIEIVAKKNIKEIVLTGIHIGQWGLEWNKNLIDLLKEIEKTSICRYRLGSLYIDELDDEILEFLSKSSKFCPHFHLSLQSMCDKTLKNMNRRYKVSEAKEVIEKIKTKFDMPFLGCDIIVGFPNETEEDFLETKENLEKLGLSYIHCFPYSKRENTPAYNFKNQIQDSVKSKRCEALMALSEQLHKKFLDENIGKELEFLVEKKSSKTQMYSAVSRNYIKIHFKSDNDNLRHELINMKYCNKNI